MRTFVWNFIVLYNPCDFVMDMGLKRLVILFFQVFAQVECIVELVATGVCLEQLQNLGYCARQCIDTVLSTQRQDSSIERYRGDKIADYTFKYVIVAAVIENSYYS